MAKKIDPNATLRIVRDPALRNLTCEWWMGADYCNKAVPLVTVPAYDSGRHWNGWACPLFTAEQLAAFCRMEKEKNPGVADEKHLAWEKDGRFYYLDTSESDNSETGEHAELVPTHQLTDGTPLYDLSIGGWCFEWES